MKTFEPGDEFTLKFRVESWIDDRLGGFASLCMWGAFVVVPGVLALVAWLRG